MTIELARRIERVATDFCVERMAGIAAQAGNPFGVRIQELEGGGTLLAAKALPLDWMNTAYGVYTADACEQALRIFGELGVSPRFHMLPGRFPEVAGVLNAAGLAHTGFVCSLYGRPSTAASREAPGISIRRIEPATIDGFLDTFMEGFDTPVEMREGSKANMRHWAERGSFRLFLCEHEGRPAGTGVLYVADGVGYLAAASTAPEFRGKGVQTALIARRVEEAVAAGCELITGQAEFGSTSQHNMERAGLRIAFTKAVWSAAQPL
jgi:GNAT superfamily N-acetyltransferase